MYEYDHSLSEVDLNPMRSTGINSYTYPLKLIIKNKNERKTVGTMA